MHIPILALACLIAGMAVGCAPAKGPEAETCSDYAASDAHQASIFRVRDAPLQLAAEPFGYAYGAPRPGERWVVVDEKGAVGMLASRGPVEPGTCYDGPCPRLYDAAWVGEPARPLRDALAIGPVDGPRAGARVLFPPPAPKPSSDEATIAFVSTDRHVIGATWQVLHAFDLDGDGVVDLEVRLRACGRGRVAVERRAMSKAGANVYSRMTARVPGE